MKQSAREAAYQALLIPRIKEALPGSDVLKNDSGYRQGIPDLSVFYEGRWAWLEVKAYEGAPEQPNQSYYVEWAASRAFGAFIYPENEEEVLHALQQAFGARR